MPSANYYCLSRPSRRKFLSYLGVGATAVAAAGIIGYEALGASLFSNHSNGATTTTNYAPPANSTTDYADFMKWLASASGPYSGQGLDISLENEFTPLALQSLDLDFLNASGINDHYSLKSYYLHLQEISTMIQTEASTYDIFGVDYQDVGSFYQSILSPTDLAEKYPDITYQSFNSQDFLAVPWAYCASYPPSPFQSSSQSAASILFLPLDMSTMLQFYRGDVYQTLGLSPATNWTDYTSNAMSLQNTKAHFGTVMEANADISIIFDYLNFLGSYGGNLWQVQNGQITTGLGETNALDALETYLGVKPYSDPAAYTYTWEEVANDLLHGIGGEVLEFQGFEAWMNDPTRSIIPGVMKYAPVPSGPQGSYPLFAGSGVGVSRFSKHPEAAWLWLQWATALGTQEMMLLGQYQAFPSRKAAFNNSQVQAALSGEAYSAVNVTKQIWDAGQVSTLLPFPKWLDVVNEIAFYLNQAWVGSTTASNALQQSIQKIQSWGALTF